MDKSDDADYLKDKIKNGLDIKVVGIVRPNEDATVHSITTTIGYTHALVEKLMDLSRDSEVGKAQLDDPDKNVFTGYEFGADLNEEAQKEAEQQAQDAAQETFLKAVRWLDSCGGFQGAFRPFLYKIAKNICIDLNRTMKRTEVSLESLPDEPAYQESGFAAAEEKANLRALTAQLEPEQRELVLLRFAQQLKLREIAQITGLPLRTVQSRLRAALKALKMQLEKEDWR